MTKYTASGAGSDRQTTEAILSMIAEMTARADRMIGMTAEMTARADRTTGMLTEMTARADRMIGELAGEPTQSAPRHLHLV